MFWKRKPRRYRVNERTYQKFYGEVHDGGWRDEWRSVKRAGSRYHYDVSFGSIREAELEIEDYDQRIKKYESDQRFIKAQVLYCKEYTPGLQ